MSRHPRTPKAATPAFNAPTAQFQGRSFEVEAQPETNSLAHLQAKLEASRGMPAPTSIAQSFNQYFAVQRKMTIGQPNDHYEQEADQVADQVVAQINTPQSSSVQKQEDDTVPGLGEQESIQRADDEDELQPKLDSDAIQRADDEDELQPKLEPDAIQRADDEDELQPKLDIQGSEAIGGGAASQSLENGINQARSGGQSLPENLQRDMGSAMGADFSGVKVHSDSQSHALNESIASRAFTTGSDIFFKSGEYNPGSQEGQKLLAHELTHTIQQGAVGKKSEE